MVQATSSKTKHRSYAKSSSFLMALLFTFLCGAVAITLGYFINYFAKGHFVEATQAIIDSEIKYIQQLGTLPTNDEHRLYIPLKKHTTLPEGFPKPKQVLTEGLLIFDMPKTDQRYAARIHTFEDGTKLLIGTDITKINKDFEFMQLLGIASIIFVMVVVFVSYLISIFVVNGTNKIADTAYGIIQTGDLSNRVQTTSKWDDLSNIGVVLNLLLEKIEDLMRGINEVSDNITHDLRTPLTRMRNHIEELLKQSPDTTEYIHLLAECDQILETFNALLRISKIETEQQKTAFTNIRLEKILSDVIEFYEPLADDKNIYITSELKPSAFFGDRDLLFQAFSNLIDNAIKYSPRAAYIYVKLTHENRKPVIVIENTDTNIDEYDLPKIFQRFYRTDKSRNKPGSGLGLSLVAAIISLHDGTVEAKNSLSGLKIITYL